jgi:hypothetical protein
MSGTAGANVGGQIAGAASSAQGAGQAATQAAQAGAKKGILSRAAEGAMSFAKSQGGSNLLSKAVEGYAEGKMEEERLNEEKKARNYMNNQWKGKKQGVKDLIEGSEDQIEWGGSRQRIGMTGSSGTAGYRPDAGRRRSANRGY